MMTKSNFLFLIVLFLHLTLSAAEEKSLIKQANKAYSEGQYNQAADLYKKVITLGYESPDLYYNLGNSYFKMNDFTSAILNFEKARKLDPSSEDINYNLAVSNSKIADKIEPLPELFYKKWFRALRELFSVDGWATLSVISLIIGLLSGFIYFASHHIIIRKTGFWLGVVFVAVTVVTLLLAYQSHRILKDNQEAIIFSPTVTIKSSPDEKSVDLFVLHEGTKVKIIDKIGIWFEIKIANGSVGWLPASAVEKI